MLITLQIKHIVPSIHVVYVVEAHEMERLTKCFANERFFLFQSAIDRTLRIWHLNNAILWELFLLMIWVISTESISTKIEHKIVHKIKKFYSSFKINFQNFLCSKSIQFFSSNQYVRKLWTLHFVWWVPTRWRDSLFYLFGKKNMIFRKDLESLLIFVLFFF